MNSIKSLVVGALAVCGVALGASSASAVGLTTVLGGPQNGSFYAEANGNYLGLFNVRNIAVGQTITLADIDAILLGGADAVNIYAAIPATGSWVGTPAAFTNVNDGITVDTITSLNPNRLIAALWVEFANAATSVTFGNGAGGTGVWTIDSKSNEVDFTPPAPIPVPAALPLLAGGLGLLALVRRRRATA